VLALAGGAVLSGCSGDGDRDERGGGAVGYLEQLDNRLATLDDEAAVEKAFRDYNQNLADRDFDAACRQNAPETTDKLLENLRGAAIEASTCEEAFAAVYATPAAGELLDAVVDTLDVGDVTIGRDTATIAWSVESEGQRISVTSSMRRIDGEWRLVDVD